VEVVLCGRVVLAQVVFVRGWRSVRRVVLRAWVVFSQVAGWAGGVVRLSAGSP